MCLPSTSFCLKPRSTAFRSFAAARCATCTTSATAADRRDRSHLGVRLRARLGHPRQGPGAHAALGLLVRAHAAHRRQPPAQRRRRATSRPRPCAHADLLAGRSMLVRKTTPLPIECVARGYLSGSGWKDYKATGAVCGIPLPAGLVESDRLPEPIFTPATKAESGHDLNITRGGGRRRSSVRELLERLEAADARALRVRRRARRRARHHPRRHQVRVRATDDGELLLIDEVLTPDSSRFWPTRHLSPGRRRSPASTSSSSATISNRSAGTSSRRCRRCRTRSSRGRATSTSKPSAA